MVPHTGVSLKQEHLFWLEQEIFPFSPVTGGSGSERFTFFVTLTSHSIELTSDILSNYGFFTFLMYPMFEHLGVLIFSLPQF